jgi:hypothetical protein
MRGMKITVDAAMRARDVSRPDADHEAMAREGEAQALRERAAAPAGTAPGPASPDRSATPGEAAAGPAKARRPHRRRRRR